MLTHYFVSRSEHALDNWYFILYRGSDGQNHCAAVESVGGGLGPLSGLPAELKPDMGSIRYSSLHRARAAVLALNGERQEEAA